MTILGHRIPMMFSLLVWFALWEAIGRLDLVVLIPPFTDVIAAGVTMLPSKRFQDAIAISFSAFAIGMAFSVTTGVVLGVLMGRVKAIGELMGMWVNIFESSARRPSSPPCSCSRSGSSPSTRRSA